MPTRNSDAPMCSHKVPSCASSQAPVTTCHGVGKIALSLRTTTIHQIAIRSSDHQQRRHDLRQRGADCAHRFPSWLRARSAGRATLPHRRSSACASASAAFPSRGAGAGSTITLSCPLGMRGARQAVGRRRRERQAEALARHDQRRAEHLRHVVRVPQQQHVVDAERQPDRVCGRISTFSPAMRRAQVPCGISNSSSREASSIGASAAQPSPPSTSSDSAIATSRRRGAPMRYRESPWTASHAAERHSCQQQLDVVHEVPGVAPVRHHRAQLAGAIDQEDRRGMVHHVVGARAMLDGRDAIVLAHRRQRVGRRRWRR